MLHPTSKRPVVHIGYHKTATTWFQKFVWPLATSHEFIPRKTTQQAFLANPGMHFDAVLARSILDLDGRAIPVLLSEENLVGYLHNGGLHGLIGPEMARRIRAVLPDAQILICIRNQYDMLRATYAQYVSGGGTFGMKRYFHTHNYVHGALTRPYKNPTFEFEHFEYDRLVSLYDSLFGKENVHVFPYEWISHKDRISNLLRDDLSIDLKRSIDEIERTANRSLGPVAQSVLRGINLFTRQSVVNKGWILDIPGWQGVRHGAKYALNTISRSRGGKGSLPPWLQKEIDDRYAPANARLVEMRDLPLEELGYVL